MDNVTAKSYTLYNEDGNWLGQVVLTSDGALMSITDWGNFSFAWRSFGREGFRQFIIGLNTCYFASKMYQGISYIAHTKQVEKSCYRFAEKILPALQKALKQEIENEESTVTA